MSKSLFSPLNWILVDFVWQGALQSGAYSCKIRLGIDFCSPSNSNFIKDIVLDRKFLILIVHLLYNRSV